MTALLPRDPAEDAHPPCSWAGCDRRSTVTALYERAGLVWSHRFCEEHAAAEQRILAGIESAVPTEIISLMSDPEPRS